MSTITALQGTDGVTTANSMTKININFSNLNTDKIETSTLDTDTTLAANSDAKIATQKAVKAYVDAGGNVNASTTTKGIVEEATAAEVAAGTATGGTGARLFVNPSTLLTAGLFKFGGTGADGALSITSGATNIDLGSAQVVVKNYTSISITGTGSLTFTNPNTNGTTIILKSQGAVTLTSSTAPMIAANSLGATGSSDGYGFTVFKTNKGVDGAVTTPGTGGAIPTLSLSTTSQSILVAKYPLVCPGAGGGSGSSNNQASGGSGASVINTGNSGSGGTNSSGGTPGAGGRGGGALIIECGGAFNFTTASGISVAGANGANATGTGVAGAGGGGAGGSCLIFYNTLTANSGTITVTGGTGGTGSNSAQGGNGATGYSLVATNTEFA